MTTDLVIAMIKRREDAAREKYKRLDTDPMLAQPAGRERAVYLAMLNLRNDIEAYRAQQT